MQFHPMLSVALPIAVFMMAPYDSHNSSNFDSSTHNTLLLAFKLNFKLSKTCLSDSKLLNVSVATLQ